MSDPYARAIEQGAIELDLFGPGLHGMSDGAPLTFEEGSIITMRILNALIGEVGHIQYEMGVGPNENDYTQVWTALNRFGEGDFGDGFAGDIVVNAPQAMTSDLVVNNLTIEAGGQLKTSGYKLFVRGTLQIDAGGVITNSGGDGANGVDGGNSGSGGPSGSLASGFAGGQGGVNAGAAGTGAAFSLGSSGGAGGASVGLGAQPGGAGGVASLPSDSAGTYRTLQFARTGELRGFAAQGFVEGGAGGGGGGGNNIQVGGGGGGGGGLVVIWANKLVNEGLIVSKGGNGGVGQVQAGGGGGGGGGLVVIVTRRSSGGGSISVAGGTGGPSEGAGDPGVDGQPGRIIFLSV